MAEPSLSAPIIGAAQPPPSGQPVFLSGVVELASGSEQGVNDAALINSTPYPLEITEIRWGLKSTASNVSGGMVTCSLALSDLKITNGFIPISGFDRSNQFYLSEQNFEGSTNVGAGLTENLSYADYVWRMPVSIIVPPGGILQPKLKHTGYVSEDITVRISMMGATIPGPYPKELNLPYVSAWQCPPIDLTFEQNGSPAGTTVEESSDEADLANVTEQVVHVHQLVGRLYQTMQVGSDTTDAFLLEDPAPQINQIVQLSLRLSTGHDIIRAETPQPFRVAFGGSTRALPCKLVIPPRQYINADLTVLLGNYATGATKPLLPGQLIPQITMIGQRKVVLQ